MEPKGSLLCSQKRATAPIAEPGESSLHYTPYTYLLHGAESFLRSKLVCS